MAHRPATATHCPAWCAGGHQCTAWLGGGTHASTPEAWDTSTGRVVATRHRGGRRDWLELRISIKLPRDRGEESVVALMRMLVVGAVHSVIRILTAERR